MSPDGLDEQINGKRDTENNVTWLLIVELLINLKIRSVFRHVVII